MKVFAHGKVILLGEHAVVHGHPALAAGFLPGVTAEARVAPSLSLHVAPWGLHVAPGDGHEVGQALLVLAGALGIAGGEVHATVHLPSGGGLGSSASLGVATARALLDAHGRPGDTPALLPAVCLWEQVFHGNPSGVDHTLAALGGIGCFTRAAGFRPLVLPAPLCLCLASSGAGARTRDMVARVASRREAAPRETDALFARIAAGVHDATAALSRGDCARAGAAMDENQSILSQLGVSTPRLEALCQAARAAGALGAKLTGGGGGGCVVALAGGREDAVLAAWRALGAEVRQVEVAS